MRRTEQIPPSCIPALVLAATLPTRGITAAAAIERGATKARLRALVAGGHLKAVGTTRSRRYLITDAGLDVVVKATQQALF
jgi:hypothetical protein